MLSLQISGTGDLACERPTDERIGVPAPHAMLGLQVPNDAHVLPEATSSDDLLPLRDRAPVLLLDGREVRRRSLPRPVRRVLDQLMCSSLWLQKMRRAEFDPTARPLSHIPLFHLSFHKHVLLIDLPSLCADVIGLRNLARDISRSYAAR